MWAVLLLLLLPSAFALDDGVTYTNFTRPGPIEIHILSIPRRNASLEIQSIHSGSKPIGRSPLTEQLRQIKSGVPLAAINGDFFQLEGAFAGDPRGLQIINRSLISAPAGTASFWIDSTGAPHIGITRSQLRVVGPNHSSSPLGLNAKCETNQVVLYTPELNRSRADTDAQNREFVLLPLTDEAFQAGKTYSFKVQKKGDVQSSFVLAFGPTVSTNAFALKSGDIVKITTATTPNLTNAVTAISGGPILIRSGKQQHFDPTESKGSKFTIEKHPRTSIGWSEKNFFWVEVDGRRKDSVGMNLNELGDLMRELGCADAINLDGGGSSTLWFDGKVRNHPSDGAERPVANSLVLVRKDASTH